MGVGPASIIKASAAIAAIVEAPSAAQVFNTGIRSLTLDGGSTAVLGLDASYLANCFIADLVTQHCTSHGLNVSAAVPAPGLIIRNLRTAHNGGDGCHIAVSNGTEIAQGYSLLNGGSGLSLSGGECEVFGWEADQDTDRGILVNNANRTLLVGCAVSQNTVTNGGCIEIRTSANCTISGCRILAPTVLPFNYPGYFFVGASFCTVTGCSLESTGAVSNIAAAVWVDATSHHITVTGCSFTMTHGQAVFEAAGAANCRYADNIFSVSLAPTFVSGTTLGNVGFNPQGFAATTPAVPAGTGAGNAVTNTLPYPVRVYVTSGTAAGVNVVDPGGTTVAFAVPPSELTLDPGAKVWYATTVPTTWKWYGV